MPFPLVVVCHSPAISVQSAPVFGETVGVPAASTVAITKSLRVFVSLLLVLAGSAGVTLVPDAVSA